MRSKNLKMYFPVTSGIIFQRKVADVEGCRRRQLHHQPGRDPRTGGGKRMRQDHDRRAILQLYKPTDGEVVFEGTRLNDLDGNSMRAMRRKMQIIFPGPLRLAQPPHDLRRHRRRAADRP